MSQTSSRRKLLAGAATLFATAAFVPTALADSAQAEGILDNLPFERIKNEPCGSCGLFTCDVVIIGAGAAGLSAAIEACEAGASVIVLEKMPQVGGNTLLAGESILVADSIRQTDPEEVREATRADMRRFLAAIIERGRTPNETLDRILLERSGETLTWLRRLGCNFTLREPLDGYKHVNAFRSDGVPVGIEVMRHLLYRAERLGIPVLTRNRVVAMEANSDGKSVKIETRDHLGRSGFFTAGAAVLATGGYAGSPELIQEFLPNAPRLMTTNMPSATGDGLVLARTVGAGFRDLDAVMMQPTTDPLTGTIVPKAFRTQGAILVNAEGFRFVNELARPEEVSEAILKQPEGFAWLIADRTVDSARQLDEDLSSSFGWHTDETILELSRTLGVNFYALSNTLEECRTTRCARRGSRDKDFVRPQECSAFTVPPFYSIRVRPAYHATTGGVLVDGDGHMLTKNGARIPRFFAAGEITGGVCGTSRLDNFGLMEAVLFGRIAGKSAASSARPRGK